MPEAQHYFDFTIDGLKSDLQVVRFTGSEGVSDLFEFTVELASDDPAIDFEAVIGKPALLTIQTSASPRLVHGIVSRFEETGVGTRRTFYGATLVPRVWSLDLRQDCCIFQEKSVPEIIQQVFAEFGLAEGDDFALNLNGTYSPREYIVQYRETDLDFICRLMEEEGIFYYFEHSETHDKIVLADDTGAYKPIPDDAKLPYRAGESGMQSEAEDVTRVRCARTLRPGRVQLRDWNFQKPTVDLTGELEHDTESHLEVYDHPGRYDDAGTGSSRTDVMLGSLRAESKVLSADTNCRRLVPGFTFTLVDHPRDAFNDDWMVLRLRHKGAQPQAAGDDASAGGQEPPYSGMLEAIPSTVLFRPPQDTEQPVIEGPQTAIVTGPSGEEIHCDEHGRVKVRFHWDRVSANDDKSSCWVRVSQAWSGSGYGGMVIPRVGNEVVVSFLEGDPDRPLVTGHVYNAGAQYGYSLPGDKTRTSLRSNSSPGGSGFNELRFEDASGGEEVFLHAQKDWNITVLNDRTEEVGHDKTGHVGRNETLTVDGDRGRKVGGNETVTVSGNQTIGVDGNVDETIDKDLTLTVKGAAKIDVTKDVTTTIDGARTTTVAKDDALTVNKGQTITVALDRSDTVGGGSTTSIAKDYSLTVAKNAAIAAGEAMTLDVKKDHTQTIGKKLKIDVADEITIVCGDAKLTLKKNGDVTVEGGKLNLKASGNVTVKGSAVAVN